MVHWSGTFFRTKERTQTSTNQSDSGILSSNYASPSSIQPHKNTQKEKRDNQSKQLILTKPRDLSIGQTYFTEKRSRCCSESNIETIMNEQEKGECSVTREYSDTRSTEQDDLIGPFHEPAKTLIIDPNHILLHRQAIAAVSERNYDVVMDCVRRNSDIILYPCHKPDMSNMKIHGAHGGTLLHLMVSEKPKLKVGGADSRHKSHECELYIISAVTKKHFDQITKLKPEVLWTADDDGCLPLHRAVMAYARALHEIYATIQNLQVKVSRFVNNQLNTIELLLKLYPQAARIADTKGNLPLHYAMAFPPDFENPMKKITDSTLLEKPFPTLKKSYHFRKNLSSSDSMNMTEIVCMLVDTYPESLMKRNKTCDLPIHLLCSKGAMINVTSLEILLFFHGVKKMSLIEKNGSDEQPLHLAIKSGVPLEAINLFATVERISHNTLNLFEQREARGFTPLQLALQTCTVEVSVPLVLLVLQVAPAASVVPDEQGLLPIKIATRLQLPDNVIRIMLEHDMPIELGVTAQENDDRVNGYGSVVHRLHRYSFWHVSVNCEDRYLNMIREFLIEGATLLQTVALAQQVGPDGVSVLINTVSSNYRRMLRSLLTLYNRYEIQTSIVSGYTPFTLLALDRGVKLAKAEERSTRYETRKVLLRCYLYEDAFIAEKNIRRDFQLSPDFIERVVAYHADYVNSSPLKLSVNENLYLISFERPFHTLEQVFTAVAPWERTGLWFTKCGVVMNQLILCLKHLHERDLVHGYFDPSSIGKYGNTWKLMNVGLAARVGDNMRGCLRSCAPPESVSYNLEKGPSRRRANSPTRVQFAHDKSYHEVDNYDEVVEESRDPEMSCCIVNLTPSPKKITSRDLVFAPGKVHTSWDIWGLGLIMVQLFLGSCPYVPNFEKSEDALLRNLQHFNCSILQTITDHIAEINEDAADLVGKLMQPDPLKRPDIKEIQKHRYFSNRQFQLLHQSCF